MDRVLGERLRVIRLLDAYGRLLRERRRKLLELYYHRDLSLAEIADQLEITRQAVFDSVHRSVDELQRLEGSLRLVARQERAARDRQAVVERVAALEDSITSLAGRLDHETIHRLLEGVTALRRLVH